MFERGTEEIRRGERRGREMIDGRVGTTTKAGEVLPKGQEDMQQLMQL